MYLFHSVIPLESRVGKENYLKQSLKPHDVTSTSN